jgi:hypothetical protein
MFSTNSLIALLVTDPTNLKPAERHRLFQRLDRLTANFAYVAIAATVVIFAAQGIRYLIQSGLI